MVNSADRSDGEFVRPKELLTQVSELAIRLTAAPPEADLCQLIAEGLKSITDALAVSVLIYDAAAAELVVDHVSVDDETLARVDALLGRKLLGLRMPVSREARQQMLAEVVQAGQSMTEIMLGAVPASVAQSIEEALAIEHFVGLALHDGDELMGRAVLVMPEGQPSLPRNVMQIVAHIAAVSLRRRQAEDALRESEQRYRTLVETSPDGIMMMDLEARILTANKELAELYGCESVESLLGRNGFEFLAPEQRQRALEELAQFREARVLRDTEYTLVRKDGSAYPAEISSSLVVDVHEKPKAIINVVRDISERKRMEQAMQRRNRELELLSLAGQALNASLDLNQVLDTALEKACLLFEVEACSVWLLDPETGELVCRSATGPHAESVLGWRLQRGEGVVGWVAQTGQSLIVPDMQADKRHFREIEHQIGALLRSALSVPMRIKEDLVGVLQVLHTDRDHFDQTDLVIADSLATSAAIALENARLYEDLQARMAQLKDAQAKLVQSAKLAAVGELAAGVAHEINNPLTSVLGFSELLLERTAPDNASRQRLESIARQARRARDIVRDLMAFARQGESYREVTDVNGVVQETLGLVRRRLEAKGVRVEEHYAADLPGLVMDTGQMKQVFLNIITNALYAMPDSGVLTIRSQRQGDGVAVQFTDTGEGIPEEDRARIFEPFFTTKPVGEGTGLGLSVSLGIVQDHGGRIDVESQEGRGSTFTVWLPVDGQPGQAF